MKEGDLITTYHKGYFRLKRIERRFTTEQCVKQYPNTYLKVGVEYSPLYHYTQEYDSMGKSKKSNKIQCCDASFCELASISISKEIIALEEKISNLLKVI